MLVLGVPANQGDGQPPLYRRQRGQKPFIILVFQTVFQDVAALLLARDGSLFRCIAITDPTPNTTPRMVNTLRSLCNHKFLQPTLKVLTQ